MEDERYQRLKKLGKQYFKKSHVAKTGEINKEDVLTAKNFLAKAITEMNPEVNSTYFEHIFIAVELGRKIAKQTEKINNDQVEFFLWLHDLGRLVSPGAYLKNDLIAESLLFEFGIKGELRNSLFPLKDLENTACGLELNEEQLNGEKSLSDQQKKIAEEYFTSLTPNQRVINLADNLGKRDDKGKLFCLDSFFQYLKTQESRYHQDELWPSISLTVEKRRDGAILQAFIVEKTVEWLRSMDIDLEKIRQELTDYGLRFVIFVRHGDLSNPKNIVYNRDSVMEKNDVIHLSRKGKKEIKALSQVIKKRKFKIKNLITSPETRTIESSQVLTENLKFVDEPKVDNSLDDVYAPGAYFEGITMDQWERLEGDAYDLRRWGKYNHESPEEVIKRLKNAFWNNVKSLKSGETAILVSHGDPIAWLMSSFISQKIAPSIKELRKITPKKGQGIAVLIDPFNKIFSYYLLEDKTLIEGNLY